MYWSNACSHLSPLLLSGFQSFTISNLCIAELAVQRNLGSILGKQYEQERRRQSVFAKHQVSKEQTRTNYNEELNKKKWGGRGNRENQKEHYLFRHLKMCQIKDNVKITVALLEIPENILLYKSWTLCISACEMKF